ncbi:PREDICTED: myb-binding protein 1A [Elephantulus edwardii]|uniref:myb-binding protein 1A n=1 Tax=Elephantulus edwardii TaxID=28737 RepID=UPI0003F0846F|nr:PREDICTED: myb-binding protein 1A [Elephantulus edwardii]
MAETEAMDMAEPMSPGEAAKNGAGSADRHDLLQHSREFLDFFWDIAKPEQETRLKATEKLLEYLRTRPKESEMKYALKRLITGLGGGRETARPCYSLALAQVLQSFEEIPLCSILEQIQEKYDLQNVKKAMVRPALFAHLFGVLALFQSGRLVKNQEALMKSIKLLQILAQHRNHLQEQPQKALVDILSEVPEAVLKEVLPEVLKADLSVVLGSPEYVELFLLARQKVPAKLKKLFGAVDLFSNENIPRLVEVLKIASASVKKERKLPAVALGLLRLALEEKKFPRFWNEVVEQGLLKKQFLPASYLCFRLLGAALPLLSKEQLQLVMRGDLIHLYGEHLVTAKLPNQFKFAPEMDEYVGAFLEGCQDDPERQLAMVVAFSSITNQGHPVVPTFWRVVQFLNPRALKDYVAWLKDMFLQPNLDSLVDFSTSNQKKNQDPSFHSPERAVFRLRKWIILRLVSIVENTHVEKEEALVQEVARFCLFHSFFETKKPTSQIPETKQQPSVPLESRIREVVCSAFFSLLQALSTHFKPVPGQTPDGQPWTYRLVQFADLLLKQNRNVAAVTPLTAEQHQAWDRMLETLKEMEGRSKEVKARAFHHLLLLVGIHLFKSPSESCDLLGDIQTCIKKSLEEKPHRTRSKATEPQEPPWVEVLVEILLSLLAQPSHLMRQVARTVFGHVCSHLTPRALHLILDVLNPEKSQEEDDSVMVTDDSDEKQLEMKMEKDEDQDSDNSDSEEEEESDGEESDEEALDGDVDQGFREQLMAVLQKGKALGGVDSDDDEELGDEAMMALDQNLASLFAEQKLRIQAKKDEKDKLQKEKALRRGFQIRVLDLVEVLVTKQPENPLVLELLEPLLTIIRRSMRSSSSKQEQDFLHKTARIFTHDLCRARHYCHDVGNHVEALHAQVERLVEQAGRQADSSIALYYFNASLYLLRVLKGNTPSEPPPKTPKKQKAKAKAPEATSCLDVNRVAQVYSSALSSFLTKRNSPLTVPMFLSLFCRHPVLCKSLLPVMVQHVTSPAQPRQQACQLLQKALSMGELKRCFEGSEWEQLISQVLAKVTENMRTLGTAQAKLEQQRELSSLELLIILLKTVHLQKLTVDLTGILGLLQGLQPSLQQSLQQGPHAAGSSRLYDLYWQAMKFLGVQRPKSEKKDAKETPSGSQNPVSLKRKKKGFLPETKKRKKRKPEDAAGEDAKPAAASENQPPSSGKKKRRHRKPAKASAQSQSNGEPGTQSPTPSTPVTNPSASASPTKSPSAPAKTPKLQKKQRKLSQVNGAPPAESAGKRPQKGLSGELPQLTPPQKKAKLALANGSPSLLQGEAKKKKKKAQLKKAGKP